MGAGGRPADGRAGRNQGRAVKGARESGARGVKAEEKARPARRAALCIRGEALTGRGGEFRFPRL